MQLSDYQEPATAGQRDTWVEEARRRFTPDDLPALVTLLEIGSPLEQAAAMATARALGAEVWGNGYWEEFTWRVTLPGELERRIRPQRLCPHPYWEDEGDAQAAFTPERVAPAGLEGERDVIAGDPERAARAAAYVEENQRSTERFAAVDRAAELLAAVPPFPWRWEQVSPEPPPGWEPNNLMGAAIVAADGTMVLAADDGYGTPDTSDDYSPLHAVLHGRPFGPVAALLGEAPALLAALLHRQQS